MATRLTKEARREQLLDTAAELLLERGAGSLTMEGLAQRAGVSKALPYVHFDNADAVAVALYQREISRLGERITEAVESGGDAEARMRAAIHAFFDVVIERGAIFAVLSGAGSSVPRQADQGARLGPRYVAALFRDLFGLRGKPAIGAANIFLGALTGAIDALAHGEAPRRQLEDQLAQVALRLARAD